MSLNQLARDMRRLRLRVSAIGNRATKQAAIVALEYLVNNTPVDTTQALSNWRVGIGGPVQGIIPARVRGIAGVTRSASAAVTIAEGRQRINSRKPGQPIHITNNLRYIEGLNNGTISNQASGFVQGAIVRARVHLNNMRVRNL